MPNLEVGDDITERLIGSITYLFPNPKFDLRITVTGTEPADITLEGVFGREEKHHLASSEVLTKTVEEEGPTRTWRRVKVKIEPDRGEYRIQATKHGKPSPNEPPVADFTFSPTNPRPGEVVHFIDQSHDPDGTVEGYEWAYGDGEVSYVESPYYTYSNAGKYEVEFEAIDNDGASDSVTKTITVGAGANEPPVADFTFSPSTLEVGEEVKITNNSHDPDGRITRHRWDWGDGTHSTGREPTHSYDEPGTYTITLTVEDNDGATSEEDLDVEVERPANKPPDADFTFSPSEPAVGETVEFTDQSNDPDGSIMRYSWNFGDGCTSTAKGPSHPFSNVGDYTVELTVEDNDGATDSITKTVSVTEEKPGKGWADFTISPRHPQAGDEVALDGTISDAPATIAAFSWGLGDGNEAWGRVVEHVYIEPGTYKITLYITTITERYDTCTKTLEVSEVAPGELNAILIPSDNTPLVNSPVVFDASQSVPAEGESITSVAWDIKSGGNWSRLGGGRTTKHTFSEEGDYTVRVTVTDSAGNRDRTTTTVNVWKETAFDKFLDWLGPRLDDFTISFINFGWSRMIGKCPIDAAKPGLRQLKNGLIYGEEIDWKTVGISMATALDERFKEIEAPDAAEHLFGMFLNSLITGEPIDKDEFLSIFGDIVTSQVDDYLEEKGITEEGINRAIENYIDEQGYKDEEALIDLLNDVGVGPNTFADSLEDWVNNNLPYVGLDIPERYGRMASFIYNIDEQWYKDHGYDPKDKPLEVHVSADLYSTFFNGAAWTDPEKHPDNWNEMLTNPYKYKDEIYDTLGIDIDQFNLKPYEEELFMHRSFRPLYNTASKMASMIVPWLETSIEEFKPTWKEITTELSELLKPAIKENLKDLGFIVPPNVKEQWATVPEALDALETISTFLDNVTAVTPDQLEELDDETEALVKRLQKLQAKPEEEGE